MQLFKKKEVIGEKEKNLMKNFLVNRKQINLNILAKNIRNMKVEGEEKNGLFRLNK